MTDLRTRLLALREVGLSALLPYTAYRLGLATGWIALRTRASEWADRPPDAHVHRDVPRDPYDYAEYRARVVGPRFFFDAASERHPWSPNGAPPADAVRAADEILGGRFRLFGGLAVHLNFPPDWFAFPPPLADRPPLNDRRHWSKVRLDAPGDDVRLVWELSRFGWAFTLARAYRLTGETKYAEGCWSLIEDWRRANPPNRGVHWASGQEAGLRILAMAFAERACFPVWRREPGRLLSVTQMIRWHAARIPPTLGYARAQGNNHLLSEAAGLYTAGVLFPELLESRRWRHLGRRHLVAGFERQVFPDGGYVQHSSNYQGLALSLGVWSARLADCNGEPFPARTRQAITRLTRSLAAQADSESGKTPCFGPDDGSEVLPLSTAAPSDVRPITGAAARLLLGEDWYRQGAWDETSRWLGLGDGVPAAPPRPDDLTNTGLHYLRGRETWGSLRCVEFHERPGHSDQLHLDLWRRGRPLTIDPGAYLYNGPPPWENALAGAVVHNGPVIDGEDPMRRAGRFLWIDRALGRFAGRKEESGVWQFSASHDGYRRLGVMVSREVFLFDEGRAWLVEDVAQGTSRRRLTVGWSLPDSSWEWLPGELRIAGESGEVRAGWDSQRQRAGLVRGGEWIAGEVIDGPVALWGWASPRYSVIEPCLRLVLEVSGDCPLLLRTRFSMGGSWPTTLINMWDDPSRLGR